MHKPLSKCLIKTEYIRGEVKKDACISAAKIGEIHCAASRISPMVLFILQTVYTILVTVTGNRYTGPDPPHKILHNNQLKNPHFHPGAVPEG